MILDNVTEIETPEQVRFRYHLAGPTRRLGAWLVDLVVRASIALACLLLVGAITTTHLDPSRAAGRGVILVVMFGLEWGYYVLFETLWNGSTPGKRAAGLRVVKEGGYPITFADSVLRNLLRAADFLPVGYLLGGLLMAADDRFRRLGDRVAGTMVIKEDRLAVTESPGLFPAPTAAELATLPARPSLSPSELDAIDMFLRRTDLAPARREELAQMLAPLLARRLHQTFADPVRFLALLHQRTRGGRGGVAG